ncbi:hypothetical protein [Sphingobacterium chuzhouense]|uniref:Uncharacterized protein n=1 Tax=Sphingobacterium chuzhouense TaxID=1742264 RepID=A0ABR7XXL5_9SPHI|nr:hypothetical protein [Sphingobacterium chuzhouense]MBD1423803.1 hypothetical protein [Sphingobacterium chuzhouense]
MNKLRRNLNSVRARMLMYYRARRLQPKIVVFESDDWGAIRSSNRTAINYLERKGYDLGQSPYSFDALESNQDLEELFNVLQSHRDSLGNAPCFTANVILANPNFDLIKESEYGEYHYETLEKTLLKHVDSARLLDLWKLGYNERLFIPQVHAREHVKYWKWMQDLRSEVKEALETYALGMCGVPKLVSKRGTSYYSPIYMDHEELMKRGIDQNLLITEAFELFEKLLGFKSKSSIAPNCGWTDTTEKIWASLGVKYIQGGFLQEHHWEDRVKYIPHFLGEKSKNGQMLYLVRNCTFEPAKSTKENYWHSTFNEVERALQLNIPAIISTHRVNYVGSIKAEMRENSLKQLNKLLTEIERKWPNIIYLNSTQLGDMIYQD